MILGEILARIGTKPLGVLLNQKVLEPMGLHNTVGTPSSEIPSPVLHAYDAERRGALGIPASTPFSEESTYFNMQWARPWARTRRRTSTTW